MEDKQDYRSAMIWLQKAADNNLPEAQYLLAENYFFGQGVQQDYKQALRWYIKEQNKIMYTHSL